MAKQKVLEISRGFLVDRSTTGHVGKPTSLEGSARNGTVMLERDGESATSKTARLGQPVRRVVRQVLNGR